MIAGTGIRFHPLFWVYHDQWKYFYPGNPQPIIYDHYGHVHLFLPSFDIHSQSGDAFNGQQKFSFRLEDLWGPRSKDPNQSQLYRVIGTPKWYFRVVELWRRVFVQPWDEGPKDAPPTSRLGLKYDASAPDKTMGPFREGVDGQKSYAPFWMANARSLPIDYFQSTNQSQAARDNAVAARARSLLGDAYNDQRYNLQHGSMVAGYGKNHSGHPAGVPPFSDELYIFPVIEYQQVTQLDWEILPGSTPDVSDPMLADENYGDGWGKELQLPFIDPTTSKYRSPFATEVGKPLEFGQYNNFIRPSGVKLVPDAQRLHHSKTQYSGGSPYTPPLDQDPATSEQPLQAWHNPWGDSAGGRVVQQCLGGRIEAKAKMIIEHKFGGRHEIWTGSVQYLPTQDFEGRDQKAPPAA